jgi:hypothetical protein
MERSPNTLDLQSNADFAGSLDAALEFIRADAAWTFPTYVLAVAPTALLALPLIGDITVHRPGDAAVYCALLIPAMIWRWYILALLQRRVCHAATGKIESGVFKRRIFPMLIVRLAIAVGAVWGAWLLVVPAFPAVILGAWIAPAFMEAPVASWEHLHGPILAGLTSAGTWRQFLLMLLAFFVIWIGTVGTLEILASFVIPSLAGISDLGLDLLLRSEALWLGILLLVWMAFDLLWHVTSVIEFYRVQSRHSGADIAFRISRLRGVAA